MPEQNGFAIRLAGVKVDVSHPPTVGGFFQREQCKLIRANIPTAGVAQMLEDDSGNSIA